MYSIVPNKGEGLLLFAADAEERAAPAGPSLHYLVVSGLRSVFPLGAEVGVYRLPHAYRPE